MKQSTKLLSLLLALVLAFSCFSVIGNAALVESELTYDNIDDADLTPEQVADLALDLVDNDLLADMETIDLSIVGELRLNSVDNILTDIEDLTGGFIWSIGKGLLGDIGDMNFDAILGKRRSGGDLNVIYALLQFIADNADRVSKIAYGIGTDNGISLGLVGSFLKLDKDTSDMLGNLPKFLTSAVFDMLLYGSYNYPQDTEELGGMNNLPTSADTLDEIVKVALLQLLLDPQDYTWEGEGKDAVKNWDTNSKIATLDDFGVSSRDALWNLINPLALSAFQIIDNIAQPAIDKFGVAALNNNLKKELMEACEVEFNEIDKAQIKDAAVLEYFNNESAYVSYIAYDAIKKASNGVWYYTTMGRETIVDPATGLPVLDENGNEQTEKIRKYYKANFGAANEFASMINWDWNFVTSDSTEEGTKLLYSELTEGGSIASGINWLLGKVYDTALSESAKADYEAMMGGFVDNGDYNGSLNENVLNLAIYVLGNFGEKIWGKDSPYAKLTVDDLIGRDIIEIVAMIGPSLFEDAMPQIILPKDAEGNYAFHSGVQIWEFGAIVLRELITGIAPNVNYDAVIFENGDVTSADDRLFAEYDADTWFNILVNMGMDLAYTYLNNITNFNHSNPTAMTSVDDCTQARWEGMLDEAIMWAVEYVGTGSDGVLTGINPTAVAAVDGPLNKLGFILNKILPLGLIGEAYTTSGQLDLNKLVDGVKRILTSFDLTALTDLFGRNYTGYNLLGSTNLVNAVLTLVNEILALVFDATILQSVGGRNSTNAQSIDAVLTQANLKTTVSTLLKALNNIKTRLLTTALPVVGKLMSGWGTEQEFSTPDIQLTPTYDLTNGATSAAVTVNIRNTSDGVWRHYVVPNADGTPSGTTGKDKQYTIIPKSVKAYNYDGSASSYMTTSGLTTAAIGYGGAGSFTFTAANVPEGGALVRVDVKYQVTDELGNTMLSGKQFTTTKWTYLNYNKTDERTYIENNSELLTIATYSPVYVPLSDPITYIKAMPVARLKRDYKLWTNNQTAEFQNKSGTVDGLNLASVSITFSNPSSDQDYKDFDGLRLFDTYTAYATTAEGVHQASTANITGSVDEATWRATNKQSGDETNFNVYLYNGKEKKGVDAVLKLKYYDDLYADKLASLVRNELDKNPLREYYNTTGTSYAKSVLIAPGDEEIDEVTGETILRDTNFATTQWFDASGNQISEPADKEAAAKDGCYEATVIDNASAWSEYYAALEAGARIGLQSRVLSKTEWDFKAAYERLAVAAGDVSYLRRTTDELKAAGIEVDDASEAITALVAQLDASESTRTDIYDFTDYRMYRLNRYNEARDDVQWYINLQDDAEPSNVTEIDEYFDYNWMEENDFRALVANDENGFDATTKANLLALLKTFDEEEIKAKTLWLEDKKEHYSSIQLIDVTMASNLLDLTEDRLLKREGAGTYKAHLRDEIASAENMITDESAYTAGSWATYEAALNNAKEALEGDSQKLMFDAKYNLLVQRKGLVEVGSEADYTELDALIEQARHALDHEELYNNVPYDFGRVLAELGMDEAETADGWNIQLFPGSALLVREEAYGIEDQDKVDRAANALKEALARLKIKGLSVTGTEQEVTDVTLVEADEEKGIEAVIAKVAHINANMNADAVKALFTVTADGAVVGLENITVSNDVYYTVDTDLEGFAGTNSTVTFYTLNAGVKIPVATVKIVVDGDINGDGTIDVLDATYGAMIAQEKGELSGVYLLAGDLNGDEVVDTADYGQIVNKAIA